MDKDDLDSLRPTRGLLIGAFVVAPLFYLGIWAFWIIGLALTGVE